jgi:uncharacterized membrane protein YfcA
MTDLPDLGPNRELPALNPLRARSTIAAVLSFVSLVGPLIGGGIGEVLAEVAENGDLIQSQTETAVSALNALVGIVSLLWLWWERRAPHFRLSFRAKP